MPRRALCARDAVGEGLAPSRAMMSEAAASFSSRVGSSASQAREKTRAL